jgi:hypothetical protein
MSTRGASPKSEPQHRTGPADRKPSTPVPSRPSPARRRHRARSHIVPITTTRPRPTPPTSLPSAQPAHGRLHGLPTNAGPVTAIRPRRTRPPPPATSSHYATRSCPVRPHPQPTPLVGATHLRLDPRPPTKVNAVAAIRPPPDTTASPTTSIHNATRSCPARPHRHPRHLSGQPACAWTRGLPPKSMPSRTSRLRLTPPTSCASDQPARARRRMASHVNPPAPGAAFPHQCRCRPPTRPRLTPRCRYPTSLLISGGSRVVVVGLSATPYARRRARRALWTRQRPARRGRYLGVSCGPHHPSGYDMPLIFRERNAPPSSTCRYSQDRHRTAITAAQRWAGG